MLPMTPTTEKAIITQITPNQQDLELNVALDQAAEHSLPQTPLKIVYELILDLAYALFIVAATITINFDSTFQAEFISYIKEPHSIRYVITLVILGVITLALAKAYNLDTKLTPQKKKAINFVQDILRGIVYVIMLVFITRFVMDHSSIGLLIFSYVLYIVSGALFFLIRTFKWIYYLCGQGKDNFTPWSSKLPPKFQVEGLSQKENELVNRIMSGLIENIKKGVIPVAEKTGDELL